MYTIELTLWDRVELDLCIPRNAPLKEIKQLLRICDVLDIDREAIDYTIVPVETQRGVVEIPIWNKAKLAQIDDEKGLQKFSFESEDFAKLKKLAGTRQSWPRDKRTIALDEMLTSAVEDS